MEVPLVASLDGDLVLVFVMKLFPSTASALLRSAVAGLWVVAFGLSPAHAETIVTYGDTENSTTDRTVTVADPLTVVIESGDATENGVISGAGNLTKSGAGTLTLTGDNRDFSGTTILADGTLSVSQSNQIGNSSSTLTFTGGTLLTTTGVIYGGVTKVSGGGTIDVSADQTTTVRFLSGSSLNQPLVKAGDGTLVFSGSFIASVPLVINAGTLQFSSNFGNSLPYAVSLSGSGALVKSGNGTLTFSGGLSAFSGPVTVTGGTLALSGTSVYTGDTTLAGGTLDFHSYFSPLTYAGAISGTGNLIKSVPGTLTLTGDLSYTGTTLVSGGRLVIDGSIATSSLTTVTTGGTLSGHGTVGALTIASGGILSPGNSPGTLAAGDTAFAGGGKLVFEINDATGLAGTAYDQVAITGGLTLTATPANPFLLDLTSLALPDNTPGLLANFDPASDYAFTFVTTTTGITGFDPGAFGINFSHFQNPFTGLWSVSLTNSGRDLALNYAGVGSAIPEPGTSAALLGAAVLASILWHRRRTKTS